VEGIQQAVTAVAALARHSTRTRRALGAPNKKADFGPLFYLLCFFVFFRNYSACPDGSGLGGLP
jgi:hypothetical protein